MTTSRTAQAQQLDIECALALGLTVVSMPEECSSHTPGARWNVGGDYYEVEVHYAYPPDKDETWHEDVDLYYLQPFSTDISAAWTLVDHMLARDGVDFYLEYYPKGSQDRWWAVFHDTNHEIHHPHISEYMQLGESHGATPAATITAAFLAAVAVRGDEL